MEKKSPDTDLYTPLNNSNTDEHFYDTTDLSSPVYDRTTPDGLSEENLLTPEERAAQDEEYKADLAKLEDEIATLRQVLGAKVHQSNILKRKLGITPWNEFKQDLNLGMKTIRESDKYQKANEKFHELNTKITGSQTYQKTNAVLKTAGEKTTSAFSTMGAFTSRKLGDMRNSTTFKSFEEKMAGAYTNVKALQNQYFVSPQIGWKAKVRGSKSETSFEDALTAERNLETVPKATEALPEEKVPL